MNLTSFGVFQLAFLIKMVIYQFMGKKFRTNYLPGKSFRPPVILSGLRSSAPHCVYFTFRFEYILILFSSDGQYQSYLAVKGWVTFKGGLLVLSPLRLLFPQLPHHCLCHVLLPTYVGTNQIK